MPPRKQDQIHNFFELRHGFEAVTEFVAAALGFLDEHGIALNPKRTYTPRGEASGNGNGATLRDKVKQHFTAQRQAAAPTNGSPSPNGTHISTTKPKKKSKSLSYGDKRRAAREHSAALLATLDRHEARPMANAEDRIHMGSLIRRGYAKKKDDGYVLTAKGEKGYDTNYKKPSQQAATDDGGSGDELSVKDAGKRMHVSDSYLRKLIKENKLAGRHVQRNHQGGTKLMVPVSAVDAWIAERA